MKRFSLHIPKQILTDLQQHAIAEKPNECCGFLAGTLDGAKGIVTAYLPLVNALASPDRFLTEARSVFQAEKRMRAEGMSLLAVCHSHPDALPIPSAIDLKENSYGATIPWLIVSLQDAKIDCRLWWLNDTSYEPGTWHCVDSGNQCL